MIKNLKKENVRVFIQDEIQLQAAKELLKKYNQIILEKWFNIDGIFVFLFFDGQCFWIGSNNTKKLITLLELETILKNESK